MKRSGDILSLYSVSIAVFVLSAVTVNLTSCGSTASIPIDDAYIWDDKAPSTATSTGSTGAAVPAGQPVTANPSSATPQLEIISQQDTTITVRIKR